MMPLTATALAIVLGVKPASVLRWARNGEIPCHRAGARIWFDLDEVNAATFRGTQVRPVVATEGTATVGSRYFEIINGRQARRGSRTSTDKQRAERSR